MPVLLRYCLESLWPPFLLSTGCVVFILNLLFYLELFLKYLLVYHAGIINSFLLLLYYQPSFLVLAVPIGFLIALLMVFGRLSADREALALESCGFSLWVLIWPMIGLGFMMSLFLVLFMDTILPWGNTSFLKLDYKIISEKSSIVVKERIFIKDFTGYVLYFDQKDDATGKLRNITVEMMDERGYPYRLVLAREGFLHQDLSNYHVILDLKEGFMQQVGTKKDPKLDTLMQMQFKNCALDLSGQHMSQGPIDFSAPINISMKELALRVQKEKSENKDTRYEETELHKKISIPFSALAFAFIAIPLGLMTRAGSILGPLLSLVLVTIYEGFILYGSAGGPMGVISPFMAMWLPNLFLGLVGFGLAYWLNHRWEFWNKITFRKRDRDKGPSGPQGMVPK